MATLTVFSSVGDGSTAHVQDSAWSAARDAGSGTSAYTQYTSTNDEVVVQTDSNPDDGTRIDRVFLPFDTSSIPDDATINSATLSFYPTGRTNTGSGSIAVCLTTQASTSSLVDADYSQVGTVRQASDITIASLTLNAYNDIALNATGVSNINKTGFTKLGLRIARDIDNSPAGSIDTTVQMAMSEATGTSQDPKLVIDYTDNTTTSTTTSTSTTSTSSSTTHTNTTTSTTTTSTSTSTTTTSTTTTSSSTTTTSSSTTTTSSSTTTTSSSTTMPFSIAVDNV